MIRIATTTLLLVLLLPFAPSPAGAQASNDLAITSLEFIGPVPEWRDGNVHDSALRVTITNGGVVARSGYRLTYEWVTTDKAQPLSGTIEASTDVGAVPISPGATRTHDLKWIVQPEQRGAGHVRVTLDPQDQGTNVVNDHRTMPVFVRVRQLDIKHNTETLELHPGVPEARRYHIENRGNQAETIQITFTDTPTTSTSRIRSLWTTTDAALAPGASLTAYMLLLHPFDNHEPFRVDRTVRLLTSDDYEPTIPALAIERNATTFPQRDSVTIRADTQTLQMSPGKHHTIPIHLENMDDMPETVTVRATAPGGWQADPQAPLLLDERRVILDADTRRDLLIDLHIPEDALRGEQQVVRVQLFPARAPPNLLEFPVRIPGPDLQILSVEANQTAYTDQSVKFTIRVENSGDAPANAPSLHTRFRSDGQDIPFTHALPPIPAGDSHTTTLDVTFPTADDYTWQTTIEEPGANGDTKAGETTVHLPALTIVVPDKLGGHAGHHLRYQSANNILSITNDGPYAETLNVLVDAILGDAVVDGSPEKTLAPGQEWLVPITHILPAYFGDATEDAILVTVSVPGYQVETWQARIESDLVDQEGPRITLQRPSTERWLPQTPIQIEAILRDESRITNGQVELRRQNELITIAALTLQPDNWEATLPGQPAGNYTIVLRADDVRTNTQSISQPLIIEAAPPPRITAINLPADGVLTQDLQFRIENLLPPTRVNAFLADGSQIPVQNANPLYTIHRTSFPYGNHSLRIVATGDNGATIEQAFTIANPSPVPSPTSVSSIVPPADPIILKEAKATPAPSLAAIIAALTVLALPRRRRPVDNEPSTTLDDRYSHIAKTLPRAKPPRPSAPP